MKTYHFIDCEETAKEDTRIAHHVECETIQSAHVQIVEGYIFTDIPTIN